MLAEEFLSHSEDPSNQMDLYDPCLARGMGFNILTLPRKNIQYLDTYWAEY
jgi:hypothetical protein